MQEFSIRSDIPYGIKARWESRGGRYWIYVFQATDGSYSFRGDNSSGHGYITLEQAIERAEREVGYWPSKAYRKL